MQSIILDMYGVIVKETGDGVVPWVQSRMPGLTREEIRHKCDLADVGALSSLEVWAQLGFTGDLEKLEREFLDAIEISEGFYAFAEKACKRGKLALLSNDSSRWSAYLREKFGLNEYFDVISVSGDLKMKKPDPRIYQRTMRLLGSEPAECVYVDDRRFNLAAAAEQGMDTVLFNTRGVDWDGRSVENFAELACLLQLDD